MGVGVWRFLGLWRKLGFVRWIPCIFSGRLYIVEMLEKTIDDTRR